jgi:hypothetical protein
MTARPTLESVRGWVEGTLPAAEREAFAAAMAADRSLVDLVATYAEVHAATVHPAPVCPVTAETLRLDDAPAPAPVLSLLRRAAPIAAAVLVVAGAAFALPALLPSDPVMPVDTSAVILRAIRPAARETPPAPPAILSRYTPATDGRLAFLDDVAEARAAARVAGRPLLIFVSMEMCPICRDMQAHAFREEDVARAANGFVLATLSATDLDPKDPLLEADGWPIFVTEDAAGVRRRIHGFPVQMNGPMPTGTQVAEELKAAHAALPQADRAALSWDDVHALVRALRDADDDADPAARRRAWASVAAKDPKGALGARARALLGEDSKDARAALDAARAVARRGDVDAAVSSLDAAARRLEGTPYAADLRAVRDRVKRDGAFPSVVLAR